MARYRILLIVLLAWALVMIVPDLLRVVQPLGAYGFSANNDGLIYDVTAPFDWKTDSPAWKAGIRKGDRPRSHALGVLPLRRHELRQRSCGARGPTVCST